MTSPTNPLERVVRTAVHPLVVLLDKMGVSPNGLTLLGLLLNLAAAGVLFTGELFWGAIAFLVASGFDMLDGALARRRNQTTTIGAFLDSTFDRLSESAVLLAILADVIRSGYGPAWLPVATAAALAGSLTVSYVRARAEAAGYECKVGWLERPERVVLLVAGLLAGRQVLGFVLFALAVLSWVTVFQRIVHVWRQRDA